MADKTTFGRRQGPSALRPPDRRLAKNSRPEPKPDLLLSAEAEAFRAELKSGPKAGSAEFSDWRRGSRGRRLLAWFATFALLSPGLLCFLFHAPGLVSTVVEGVGLAANWWLRRERRRRLQQITQWEPPAVANEA